ncbi:MAG: hypothetical protein DRP74_06380 [Candidatus Omnitrophota bacterium]|nr:MAG: hypothetical protein DRP74_06380 [Candidatus Omnitrophota bacterium]
MKVRIYYHHTDCGKVVYYANYLKFLEEARTEFFESKEIFVKELTAQGILFVVARQEIDYKRPAFYGDLLNIDTKLAALSKVRIEFEYEIKNQNGQIISNAKTIMACVDKDLKPISIPLELYKKLGKNSVNNL